MNNKKLSMIALSILAAMSAPAIAQQNDTTPNDSSNAASNNTRQVKLERIEVTSQKRVENLQDVPLSVVAMNEKQLERVAIDKIEDLQVHIPNLSMTETGLSTQTFIRGIGSGNNQGFEQSVVQFVDGVSYARQQLTRAPFFDMERVEVLRGPQSILFGKNAIGGALNFTTAQVEEDNSGKIFAQLGEFGIQEYQGIVNRELIDSTLYGRLSVRSYKEDGFIKNDFLDRDEPQRDDLTIRAKLKWLVSNDTTVNLKYERNEFDTKGRQIEIVQDEGNPGNPFGLTLAAGFGLTQAITDTELDYHRSANGDSSFNQSDALVVDITSNFGQLEFTSTTGYLTYEFDDLCDCDYTGAPVFTVPMHEEYNQFSQEFRLASPLTDSFAWQAGIFYQSSELDFTDEINIAAAEIGDPATSVLPTAIFALTQNAAFGNALSGIAAGRVFTQDADSISVFAEGRWHVQDNLVVTFGGRWSKEDKDGFRELNVLDDATREVTTNPYTAPVLASLFAIESEQTTGHSLTGARSETAFDPSIKVQYDINDDLMLYASWSKGSKSGGFDARANTVTSFEFQSESAKAFEAGFKSEFWDSRARINAAFFFTDYEDLQVSQFDGVLGFVVGNADTEVSGIEVDGSFALTQDLTLSYSAAYLDQEFTDYENGNCYYLQGSDTSHPDMAARYNPDTGLCNYTGLTGQYIPEFSGNLNLDYYYAINGDLDLHVNVNYNYVSSQHVHQNLDPEYYIDGFGKLDINIGVEAMNWGVELLGRNITDQEFMTYAGNVPLSGTFGADAIYAFVAPPSTWTLRAYYVF